MSAVFVDADEVDGDTMKATGKKHKTFILAVEGDDPEKELEFELNFQMSLTPAERYEIMNQLVKDGLALIQEHGYQNDTSVIIRS
jgi:hypothetical protein